jgi:hypothetical protein
MRQAVLAGLACLLCSWTAGAQINPGYRLPTSTSEGSAEVLFVSDAASGSETFPFARSFDPAVPMPGAAASFADPTPPDPPQGVYGVFPRYAWQVSAGYTFVRFNEVPGTSENLNGGYGSVVYYVKDWIGAEGEVFVAFGTLSGSTSHLLLGAGGARARWQASHGIELWVHALAGVSNLAPQTAYGATHAFGFEAGAGVDLGAHRRWAYRIEGDAVGTLYFNTYQVSPRVSVGVVYKF